MTGEQAIMDAERLEEIKAEVHEKFPATDFPSPVKEPIWYGKLKRERYQGKHAIVDGRNRENTFSIVSDQYKIVTHEEVIHNAMRTIEKFQEYGEPEIKIVTFNDGGRMKLEIVFPEVKDEIVKGDMINPRFILKNSYDVTWRLKTTFGAFRLVCSNGMTIGKKISSTANKHTINLDIDKTFEILSKGMETYSEQTSLWSKWAETKIGLPMYENVLEELPFSETEIERIQSQSITGSSATLDKLIQDDELTVWELNNALTQYITHDIQSQNRKIEAEERVGIIMHKRFGALAH